MVMASYVVSQEGKKWSSSTSSTLARQFEISLSTLTKCFVVRTFHVPISFGSRSKLGFTVISSAGQ